MKKIALLFIALFTVGLSFSQDDASIFYISFRMDEDLTNDLEVSFNERQFMSGYSEKPVFPENLIDSVKLIIERAVSSGLNAKAVCIYKLNKKGEPISTLGMGGELEGMPVNTKKKAILQSESAYYVRVDVNIIGRGGVSVGLPDGKRSRLKPAITFSVSAFDKNGKNVFKKSIKVKEFGVLKSKEVTSTDGSVSVRKAEILYPEDIIAMLRIATHEFLQVD